MHYAPKRNLFLLMSKQNNDRGNTHETVCILATLKGDELVVWIPLFFWTPRALFRFDFTMKVYYTRLCVRERSLGLRSEKSVCVIHFCCKIRTTC